MIILLYHRVATVNRFVIDRGLFFSTTTHGQERADRGYLDRPAIRTLRKLSQPRLDFTNDQKHNAR